MTAFDLTLTCSMTGPALACRADSVAEDLEMHLPNGYGYGRVFFHHDGEVSRSRLNDYDAYCGGDFTAEIIGAVVDFADDDPAWADRVLTREEMRSEFGDAWVASVEARQAEKETA